MQKRIPLALCLLAPLIAAAADTILPGLFETESRYEGKFNGNTESEAWEDTLCLTQEVIAEILEGSLPEDIWECETDEWVFSGGQIYAELTCGFSTKTPGLALKAEGIGLATGSYTSNSLEIARQITSTTEGEEFETRFSLKARRIGDCP